MQFLRLEGTNVSVLDGNGRLLPQFSIDFTAVRSTDSFATNVRTRYRTLLACPDSQWRRVSVRRLLALGSTAVHSPAALRPWSLSRLRPPAGASASATRTGKFIISLVSNHGIAR